MKNIEDAKQIIDDYLNSKRKTPYGAYCKFVLDFGFDCVIKAYSLKKTRDDAAEQQAIAASRDLAPSVYDTFDYKGYYLLISQKAEILCNVIEESDEEWDRQLDTLNADKILCNEKRKLRQNLYEAGIKYFESHWRNCGLIEGRLVAIDFV